MKCIIIGDLNLDYNKINSDNLIKSYFNMLNSYNYYNKISCSTRITSKSSTAIDHIYTNNTSININTSILINDISDHFPIFGLIKTKKQTKKIENNAKRNYSKLNIEKFVTECKLISPH